MLYYYCPTYVFHASYASKADASAKVKDYAFGSTATTMLNVDVSRTITVTEKD